MKKLIFLSVYFLLLFYSCEKGSYFPPELLKIANQKDTWEKIMNGKRVWKLAVMESDKPRNFVTTFVDQAGKTVTIQSRSTDWLSQIRHAVPNNMFTLSYHGSSVIPGKMFTDSLYFSLYREDKIPEQESASNNQYTSIGLASSFDAYNKFEINLGKLSQYLYGYITKDSTLEEEQQPEIWTHFQVKNDQISFQVQKRYQGESFLVKIRLIPFDDHLSSM